MSAEKTCLLLKRIHNLALDSKKEVIDAENTDTEIEPKKNDKLIFYVNYITDIQWLYICEMGSWSTAWFKKAQMIIEI